MVAKLTSEEVLNTFSINPNEVDIKNKKCPTKHELKEVRRTINNVLHRRTCTNSDYAPYKWAVIVIPKDQWIENKMKKLNKEIKAQALIDAKAAAADQAARDALTIDSAATIAIWTPLLRDENSVEVQLPEYDRNPDKFVIDNGWTDKQMRRYKIEHDVLKEDFEEYKIIDGAVILFMEECLDKSIWSELDTGDEFMDNHSARKILEHLESKFTEDQPVAIEEELNLLNKEPNLAEGLGKYFARIQGVHTRMKTTDEPVTETTMKRIVLGQLKKIPHMQEPMDDWKKLDNDKLNPKSFSEFRDYCIAEDIRKMDNKQTLSKMGVANAVVTAEENPRVEALEDSIIDIAKALSVLSSDMKSMKQEPPKKEPTKKEDSTAAILAQLQLLTNSQCLAAPQPASNVSALEKQLSDITSKLNNISNSGTTRAGTNTSGGRGKGKYVKKELTFNMYCSSCGVNPYHENDNCPPKKRQSWHQAGATWTDKKGGNTSKDHLWGKKKMMSFWEKDP